MDQLLFEKNPIPMLIYDLDSLIILKVNEAFLGKYKYAREEIERGEVTIKDFHPTEDIPKLLDSIDHLDRQGVNDSGVHRHLSKEGDVFFMRIASQEYPSEGHNARLVASYDVTEQIEMEQKSTEAYHELQHHITNSPLASVKWDPDFKITEWSDQAARISGYSSEEVVGESLFALDIFSETEKNKIRKRVRGMIKGDFDRDQFEATIIQQGGSRLYIRIHSSALRSSTGKLKSVLTLIEDITEHKKSKIKYRRLFENANDSIFIMKDGRFVDCNKQAEALLKASKTEIIGKTPHFFSPRKQPSGRPSKVEARMQIQKALSKGSTLFEWQHKDAHEHLIDVEVSLNKVHFPDGEYVQAIVRDVTESKKTQAEFRKSEELFRNLFLKSPAALVMVDAEDRILVVNNSFEKMFGYELAEIQGKNIDELVVPVDERTNTMTMRNKGFSNDDFRVEGVRLTKNGDPRHAIVAGMPIQIDDETVAGIGMYIDITERKASEKRLKESLQEKQFLLGEIHHRVKNNLAVISGFIQLQAFDSDDENIQKALEDSQLRVKSIALVHELLYQSESFSDISLRTYIKQLLSGITNILSVDTEHIDIEIDVEEVYVNINQAIPCAMLINELITNAYKHAFTNRDGGTVTVSVTREGRYINLQVADNGRGLPSDLDVEGTSSLGMNLIETLARQLEANLTFSNDNGAVFNCSFEVKPTAAAESMAMN